MLRLPARDPCISLPFRYPRAVKLRSYPELGLAAADHTAAAGAEIQGSRAAPRYRARPSTGVGDGYELDG